MKLHKDWLSKTNLIKQVSCAPSLGFLHFFLKCNEEFQQYKESAETKLLVADQMSHFAPLIYNF